MAGGASAAAAHLRLLETVLTHAEPEECADKLANVAEGYLKRSWRKAGGNKDRGAVFNANVDCMLKCLFRHGSDVESKLEEYGAQLTELTKEETTESEVFRTFNMSTLPLHFRALLEALGEHVKGLGGGGNHPEDKLDRWNAAVVLLHKLMGALKVLPSARLLMAPAVKHSRVFLDHFLRHCMPLLERQFRAHREKCVQILRSMQGSTRQLQHVCSHTKYHKDAALSGHVPALKRGLEAFLYRVKSMLAANDVVEAFWMGNLKNRDLAGEEIERSQAVTNTSVDTRDGDEVDEDDAVLPEEEQSDIDDPVEEESNKSDSNDADASLTF